MFDGQGRAVAPSRGGSQVRRPLVATSYVTAWPFVPVTRLPAAARKASQSH
jgi:hypothetical protein